MARTSAGADLTRLHRAEQDRIADDVQRTIGTAWHLLNLDDLDATARRWAAAVLPQILAGRERSATVAAAYLRAFAAAEIGAGSATVMPTVTDADRTALATSLRVTGPVTVKALTASGYDRGHSAATARERVLGAAQRHVLNGGRETVRLTAVADPRMQGWRRVGTPDCDFCKMLLGRGAVYTEASAQFRSHDRCDCTAEPAY